MEAEGLTVVAVTVGDWAGVGAGVGQVRVVLHLVEDLFVVVDVVLRGLADTDERFYMWGTTRPQSARSDGDVVREFRWDGCGGPRDGVGAFKDRVAVLRGGRRRRRAMAEDLQHYRATPQC